jgi:hypothetical protein
MHPVLDLSNQSNWQQIFDEEREAVQAKVGGWYPIPAFEIPILFDSSVVVARVLSNKAKSTWHYGGLLSQRFFIGSGGTASSLPEVSAKQYRLQINRSKLLFFPLYKPNYSLIFEPPVWFKNIRLSLWEYSGINSDSTHQLLETIKIDILRIESIINGN